MKGELDQARTAWLRVLAIDERNPLAHLKMAIHLEPSDPRAAFDHLTAYAGLAVGAEKRKARAAMDKMAVRYGFERDIP